MPISTNKKRDSGARVRYATLFNVRRCQTDKSSRVLKESQLSADLTVVGWESSRCAAREASFTDSLQAYIISSRLDRNPLQRRRCLYIYILEMMLNAVLLNIVVSANDAPNFEYMWIHLFHFIYYYAEAANWLSVLILTAISSGMYLPSTISHTVTVTLARHVCVWAVWWSRQLTEINIIFTHAFSFHGSVYVCYTTIRISIKKCGRRIRRTRYSPAGL